MPARPCRRRGRRRRGWCEAPARRGRRPARSRPSSGPGRRRDPRPRRSPRPGGGRRLGSSSGSAVTGAGSSSARGRRGLPRSVVVDETSTRTPMPAGPARRRRCPPTATTRTSCRWSWSTAARSRPGASIATTAVSAWPALLAASRSSTSTQRLRTTRPRSRRRAARGRRVSQAAPAATSRTTTISAAADHGEAGPSVGRGGRRTGAPGRLGHAEHQLAPAVGAERRSTGGASTTVTPASTGRPPQTGASWHPLCEAGRR